MAHPPNWCNAVYSFRRFFPSSDSGMLGNRNGGLLMFPSSFSWHYMLPVLSQALVCTLFKFRITEVRCQFHYTSAKSWILIKGPGVDHPLGCFQNDHTSKLKEKLLLARNTQYVYCKSITGEILLHQHLHTMCCQKNTHCTLSFYLYVLLLCSWCWGRILCFTLMLAGPGALGQIRIWSDLGLGQPESPPPCALLFPAPQLPLLLHPHQCSQRTKLSHGSSWKITWQKGSRQVPYCKCSYNPQTVWGEAIVRVNWPSPAAPDSKEQQLPGPPVTKKWFPAG